MKNKALFVKIGFFVLGFLCAALVIFAALQIGGYRSNINGMLPTLVRYKDVCISTYLSSDVCDQLADGKKTVFMGQLPDSETAIEINSPQRATLMVYPLDEDSIVVRYVPRVGLPVTYKVSGYGNFDFLRNAFFELTGNEVFRDSAN